jgi:replicative DNA helicase
MNALYSDNDAIDIVTVSARLRSMNKLECSGGDYVLIELTQKIATSAHIEKHARLLQQFYIKSN